MQPRTLRPIVAGALAVLLLSTTAAAQTAPEEGPAGAQVGVSSGLIVFFPTLGARVTLPLRGTVALEASAEVVPYLPFDEDDATHAFFQGQFRHRFGRWGRWRAHATYGATVFAKYTRSAEFRQTRPDGSVLVYPGYRRLRLQGRPAVHGGVGAERLVSKQVVVRWDVQAIVPVAVQAIPVPRATLSVAWRP